MVPIDRKKDFAIEEWTVVALQNPDSNTAKDFRSLKKGGETLTLGESANATQLSNIKGTDLAAPYKMTPMTRLWDRIGEQQEILLRFNQFQSLVGTGPRNALSPLGIIFHKATSEFFLIEIDDGTTLIWKDFRSADIQGGAEKFALPKGWLENPSKQPLTQLYTTCTAPDRFLTTNVHLFTRLRQKLYNTSWKEIVQTTIQDHGWDGLLKIIRYPKIIAPKLTVDVLGRAIPQPEAPKVDDSSKLLYDSYGSLLNGLCRSRGLKVACFPDLSSNSEMPFLELSSSILWRENRGADWREFTPNLDAFRNSHTFTIKTGVARTFIDELVQKVREVVPLPAFGIDVDDASGTCWLPQKTVSGSLCQILDQVCIELDADWDWLEATASSQKIAIRPLPGTRARRFATGAEFRI